MGYRDDLGISVKGVATFHDSVGGARGGKNSVYVVELEGLRFCHLGDLGHKLTREHVAAIGAVDVLFIPVGGGPTLGPALASSIVERLDPRIVVQMHYNAEIPGQSEVLSRMLHKVDDFLATSEGNVERLADRAFKITKKSLPKRRKIVVPTLT